MIAIAGAFTKPRAPGNLDEVLAAACEGVAGITAAQFRALLSPEDVEHIAGGDIPIETLRAYAASMGEGGRSERLALLRNPRPRAPPALKAAPGAYTDHRRHCQDCSNLTLARRDLPGRRGGRSEPRIPTSWTTSRVIPRMPIRELCLNRTTIQIQPPGGFQMPRATERYTHPTADALLRPDIGTQAQFRKKKPPAKYRYDSSLSPALETDGQNPARERAEALIRKILDATDLAEARAAGEELRTLGQPFLNWAGKAERLSFEVPTLPSLSMNACPPGDPRNPQGPQAGPPTDDVRPFRGPRASDHEQVLRAYEQRTAG